MITGGVIVDIASSSAYAIDLAGENEDGKLSSGRRADARGAASASVATQKTSLWQVN